MHRERRQQMRIEILGDAPGSISVIEPIRVADLSPTGARIETHAPLAVGSLHDVRLALGEQTVIVRARIVHATVNQVDRDRTTYQVGLNFVDVEERIANALRAFVRTLSNAR